MVHPWYCNTEHWIICANKADSKSHLICTLIASISTVEGRSSGSESSSAGRWITALHAELVSNGNASLDTAPYWNYTYTSCSAITRFCTHTFIRRKSKFINNFNSELWHYTRNEPEKLTFLTSLVDVLRLVMSSPPPSYCVFVYTGDVLSSWGML